MQYALMIYAESGTIDALSEPDRQATLAEFAVLTEDPRWMSGTQLQPVETATNLRMVDSHTLITDGPFADTKEVLGGMVLIEAADLDEALEFAERIPVVRFGGGVEVRPVVPR